MNAEKLKSSGYKALTEADSEFTRKIEQDPYLPEVLKDQMLDYLKNYDESKDKDILGYTISFLRMHKQVGPEYSGNAERFIRTYDISRFLGRINEITKRDMTRKMNEILNPATPPAIKKMLMKTLLAESIKDVVIHDPDKSNYYFGYEGLPEDVKPELGEANTGSFIEWSFPEPESEDLFVDSSKEKLDCRAGLSQNINLDKVLYSHQIKHCNKVTRPTVFDAETYPQFEPGGKTKPLEDCKDEDGFEEYVHTPNRYKYIERMELINKNTDKLYA